MVLIHHARDTIAVTTSQLSLYSLKDTTLLLTAGHFRLLVPTESILIPTGSLYTHRSQIVPPESKRHAHREGGQDILPPKPVSKFRSPEIGCYNDRIDLKLIRHLGSATADVHVKFLSDWKCLTRNSRLRDFTRSCDKRSAQLTRRFEWCRGSVVPSAGTLGEMATAGG